MLEGLHSLISLEVLLGLAAGTLVGIAIGSLPGIGPAVGIAILLPLTFVLRADVAIVFYITLYQAAEYGGSITAIALGIPGAPNSAATILDGYPLARRLPGLAFAYSLWPAVTASLVTIVAILVLVGPLDALALALGSVEVAALGIFALATIGVLATNAPLRGLVSCALGLVLGSVGLDSLTAYPRFTFDLPQLYDGISLLPLLVGVFAIPAAVRLLFPSVVVEKGERDLRAGRVWLSWRQFRGVLRPTALGTAVGAVIGVLPGLSGSVPPWISYNLAKTSARDKDEYGTGAPGGIAAPEATNASVMHATLVPTFALGIPGTPTSAVIIGAMTIAGLRPGPAFLNQQRPLFYEIFFALFVSALLLWVVGIGATQLWAKTISLPPQFLGVAIFVLCVVGSFVTNSQILDVWLMLGFGLLGVLMERFSFSVPALVLGFIVGPIIETNLRRVLVISHGNLLPFATSPIAMVLLTAAVALVVLGFVNASRGTSHRGVAAAVSGANPRAGVQT